MLHILAAMLIGFLGMGAANVDPGDEYVGVLAESAIPGWQINDFKCVSLASCPAGAVYVPTVNGQKIKGCEGGTGTGNPCSGVCSYCAGGTAAVNRCKRVAYEKCEMATGTTPVACGAYIKYNCVFSATPPGTPAGQSIQTDNDCYCGTTPGTTGGTGCSFTDCLI